MVWRVLGCMDERHLALMCKRLAFGDGGIIREFQVSGNHEDCVRNASRIFAPASATGSGSGNASPARRRRAAHVAQSGIPFSTAAMKFALSLIALVLLALIMPFFIPGLGKQTDVDPNANLPWQIAVDGQGGSTVFGLRPGVSTLGDVRRKLGNEIEVAIIAAPNEIGSLEGYYAQLPLGFVLAKMVVTVDVPDEAISAMRERALKATHMESTTRRITLHPDDLAAADKLPIRAISVIPTVNLDEATIVQRFGEPGERVVLSDRRTHLLYPGLGLDVVVDKDGKELLQYVAPQQFARLREPLPTAPAEISHR